MKKSKIRSVVLITIGGLAVCVILIGLLLYNGVIFFNNPSPLQYPVKGVDVSSYQGTIDWQVLAGQGIDFAFIKATEGSSHVDSFFAINYENAKKTNLRIGAYHFFSYDSSGATQAELFIANVAPYDNMLPPVVDVEFYGDKEKNLPDKEATHRELTDLLLKLEEHYGFKPIIYATEKSYRLYIENAFEGYDIWIRNVITSPNLSDDRSWTFWQYTNRDKLEGYSGKEQYIDMNVYNGSKEQFDKYAK